MKYIMLRNVIQPAFNARVYMTDDKSGYRERIALAHAMLHNYGETPNHKMMYDASTMQTKVTATYDGYKDIWNTNIPGFETVKVWLEGSDSMEGINAEGFEFFDVIESEVL